jgi:hypothetical protein
MARLGVLEFADAGMPAGGDGEGWSACGRHDLAVLRELVHAGQIAPVIGRACPLSEVAEAIGTSKRDTPGEKSASPYEPF